MRACLEVSLSARWCGARSGMACDTACNGDEALARVATTRYDAVVTDVIMPLMVRTTITNLYRCDWTVTNTTTLPPQPCYVCCGVACMDIECVRATEYVLTCRWMGAAVIRRTGASSPAASETVAPSVTTRTGRIGRCWRRVFARRWSGCPAAAPRRTGRRRWRRAWWVCSRSRCHCRTWWRR